MRIALVGAGGQLASDLLPLLPVDAVPLSHNEIELTDPDSVARALERVDPDVVINTAAYNLVDQAEDEPAVALSVNAIGARHLALACRDRHCTMVHLSSDYVFGLDAERRRPYREDDCPGPVSVYGTSKLAGELFVRSLCPKHVIVRTCGLYGLAGSRGKGGNFVETMLRLSRRVDGSEPAMAQNLQVVDDQCCTPSATLDVARAVAFLASTDQYGLYHVTNSGSCTWFELAREIFRLEKIDVAIAPITSAEFGARAARPAYSVLACDRYERLGGAPLPPWREALASYLEQRRQAPS